MTEFRQPRKWNFIAWLWWRLDEPMPEAVPELPGALRKKWYQL